jgi:hypothetical protein
MEGWSSEKFVWFLFHPRCNLYRARHRFFFISGDGHYDMYTQLYLYMYIGYNSADLMALSVRQSGKGKRPESKREWRRERQRKCCKSFCALRKRCDMSFCVFVRLLCICVCVCVCVLGTWKLNRDEEEKRSTAVEAMVVGCICHGCQLARCSGILPDDNKRSPPRLIVLDGGKWRMLSI